MDTTAVLIILLLCCCIILLIGGFGFFLSKTPEKKSTPTITLDGVTVEAEVEEESTTENYTYDELSKNIKLNIKWSNGSDFDDVTNVYFTRTHGDKTEKKETDANGRKSNTTGNKIQFVQKPGEDMRGEHTIKVTYKLRGQTQEKVMTTFQTNISDDQLTLAADSVSPVSVSYSPATVPFSTEVETQKTTTTLNPNPSGFGALFFIPSGTNNAIKIKRVSDGKFLTHSATWGATGGVFYVQSSTGDKRRISTTTTDDGKLLTSVGPALKNYTDMNPEERQKSLFILSFSPAIINTCVSGSVCPSKLTSPSGACVAVTQDDGNYVVYESGTAIWDSKTTGQGTGPYRTDMQNDGNLVLYDSKDTALWDSKTYDRGTGPYRAIMQDDCNLVVYDSAGSPTWSSKGGLAPPPSQYSLLSRYLPSSIYNNMKAQAPASGVNAYKGNYYHEGVSSKYPGHVVFTVSDVPGSDWRAKGTYCFNKCTDLGDDCRIMTLKKDANNNVIGCSGHGINAYSTRVTGTTAANHASYHKRTP